MKTRRALIIALVVSLTANLLVAGVFLGRAAGPKPEMFRADPLTGMRRLVRDLPAERAEALAPLYREYFAAMRPRFRDIRQTQRSLRATMLADPLDEEALLAALEAFHGQLTATHQATAAAFVALASELTLSEREQLVEQMDRPPERRRGDRPPPGGPDGQPHPPGEPPYHHIRPEPPLQ
jgi:hypothetical protein